MELTVSISASETVLPTYGVHQIKLLKGLEAVRKRPAMYVGDAGTRGLHHMAREVFDNSVDEAMNGHCDLIKVLLHKDGRTLTITDNGRGIPVGIHPTEGISTLLLVMTNLHAGGKFEEGAFKAAGGLHGVGIKCVNALSEKLTVTVGRTVDDVPGLYRQEFHQGQPVTDVIRVSDTRKSGTSVTFAADPEIFTQGTEFDINIFKPWFEETAFLNAGLTIMFKDERSGEEITYRSDKGIAEFVERMSAGAETCFPVPPITFEREVDGIWIQCSLHWTDMEGTQIYGFANNIRTHDGGTHVNGLTNALPRILNKVGKTNGILKEKDASITKADALDGLVAVVNVRVVQPSFQGQTKDRLMTSEVEPAVSTLANESLTEYFEKNPVICKQVVSRAMLAQQIRAAKNKASDNIKRQSFLGKVGRLPGKLYDCEVEDNSVSELFIVEGDSAAGSAKQGRDAKFQAVLPIRGKIINSEKHEADKLLANKEVQSLISAIGTGVGDNFNLNDRRYDKIVILSDADVDGLHIRALLLACFERLMPGLIRAGHVYVAMPPLYRLSLGKKVIYCYDDAELEKAKAKLGDKAEATRFKGLGEMNWEELGETTMRVGPRKILQVTMNDPEAGERMLATLMGSNVAARKAHIIQRSTVMAVSG